MRPDPRQPPLAGLDTPPPPKKGFEPQPSRAPRFRRPIHSVAGLRERARITADPHAKADPAGAALAAWSLVHGFAQLWLNDAIDKTRTTGDPIATVERLAAILFDG